MCTHAKTLKLQNFSLAHIKMSPERRRKQLKAKFHYASWFEAGWFEAGRRQVRSWSPTSFEPVRDQLRTSFEPASVMEFGFNRTRFELTNAVIGGSRRNAVEVPSRTHASSTYHLVPRRSVHPASPAKSSQLVGRLQSVV